LPIPFIVVTVKEGIFMGFIKNYDQLATTPERKIALDLVETAFTSIQPDRVMAKSFSLQGTTLTIADQTFDISHKERISLLGFGKGSAGICRMIEDKLGDQLTAGFDIDVVDQEPFAKIQYTKGDHPLPTQTNIDFTRKALSSLSGMTEKDLVLVVICGGGSAMLEDPYKVDLETLSNVGKALLQSGANISEMNVVRKHLSTVKGGGLAKHLYPATVASLIFSDVPGNDLSVIASGPTVRNTSSLADVHKLLDKYDVRAKVQLSDDDFLETPTGEEYFADVHNILIVSNMTALKAMQQKAEEQGLKATILSDRVQGDARTLGVTLIDQANPGEIMLAGGESTIKITGSGKGGRNQALVLSSLSHLQSDTLLVSFDSDGWDFYGFAGALADQETLKKAQEKSLDPESFLKNDDSYGFFAEVGDGIDTGKLEANVSDLYIVWKK
jgi:glycerate-2-kinase